MNDLGCDERWLWWTMVVIFLNVSVRLKFINCFFPWKLWCCVGGVEKINMVLSTDLIKLKFRWLALLEAPAIETLYSRKFTSPTRLGKKISIHNGTSDGFLKSFYRRTFLLHIVHNESCLNILDTNKRYFYIRLQSKIPCTLSTSWNWIRVLH